MPSDDRAQVNLNAAMWMAAARGDSQGVRDLKSKGADPKWFHPWEPPGRAYQFTALHIAAGNGRIDNVKYLVEKVQVDIWAKSQVTDGGPTLSTVAQPRAKLRGQTRLA